MRVSKTLVSIELMFMENIEVRKENEICEKYDYICDQVCEHVCM